MSSVQNHNNVTINFYNGPAQLETYLKPRGLTVDKDFNDDSDLQLGDDDGGAGAFDKLPLPAFLKAALKNLFSGADANLPSSADAARTIRDFQKENNIALLSSSQIQEAADTGYCQMPNGERQLVPPEVQAAAQKMMANNGELFKKLETSIRPEHDGLLSAADYDAALKDGSIGKPGTADLPTTQGLDPKAFLKFVMDGTLSPNRPSEYNAAKTIQAFQQKQDIQNMSSTQMQQIASTGYCTSRDGKNTTLVPPDVQAAAQKMMANNGELFKKLETAIRTDPDGLLSAADTDAAVDSGKLDATPALEDDEGDDDDMINDVVNQGIQNLANRPDNVSEDDDDNSEMINNFLKQAIHHLGHRHDKSSALLDLIAKLATNDAANGLPSSSDAAKTLHDFQGEKGISLITSAQVEQMATTGYVTKPDGKTEQVPPEVQAAAQKAMDNNGQLFKLLEAAVTGEHDGLLAQQDYDAALKDGSIGKPTSNAANAATPAASGNASGAQSKSDLGALNAMENFQKSAMGDEMLSRAKLQEMANTGKLTKDNGETVTVPQDVQAAAKTMLANNGALFDKLEVAHNGKKDSLVSLADYEPAIDQSIRDAAKAITSFQKSELGGDFMTLAMMKEIAETGNLTKNDASKVQVPQNVVDAARAYMDNDAKLFKDAESWQDNKQDNKLSVKDSEKRADALDD